MNHKSTIDNNNPLSPIDEMTTSSVIGSFCFQQMVIDTEQSDAINQQLYHMDYGTCTLTCIHKKVKQLHIKNPSIIQGGLCSTLPLEVPDLQIDHLRANHFNCSQLMYEIDKKF